MLRRPGDVVGDIHGDPSQLVAQGRLGSVPVPQAVRVITALWDRLWPSFLIHMPPPVITAFVSVGSCHHFLCVFMSTRTQPFRRRRPFRETPTFWYVSTASPISQCDDRCTLPIATFSLVWCIWPTIYLIRTIWMLLASYGVTWATYTCVFCLFLKPCERIRSYSKWKAAGLQHRQ